VFRKLCSTVTSFLVAALASMLFVPASGAANVSVSVTTKITGAQLVQDCSHGANSEGWQVSMSIKVKNASEGTATFQDTEFWAKYSSPSAGSNQIDNDVTVVDSGGFVAGTQLAQGETKTFGPTVGVSLPCDTQSGDMFAALHLVGNDKQYSDGNTFIGGNTPVPSGAAGVISAAVLLSAAAFLAQRVGRRRPGVLKEISRS